MSETLAGPAPAVALPLYRAVWRWHFYAGLLVLPVMCLLAVTGALYLFKDEINDRLHPELRLVAPAEGPALAPSALVEAAVRAVPGTPTAYLPAPAPDRSPVVKIEGPAGVRAVYLEPSTGRVLGDLADAGFAGSPEMKFVRDLHSLKVLGWPGNRIVELAACWSVVLVGTGVYLWWPRGRRGGVWTWRGGRGRTSWRDLHAVTGAYASIFILFLALTGLPWSGVWGDQFYQLAHALGIGMPDGYWDGYPVSTVPTGEALDRAPWALEQQPMPLSGPGEGPALPLDRVVAAVEALGIAPGYAVDLPADPTGVFTASVYPDRVAGERVIHLDQYSGAVLYDAGFADLGALGAAAEWGVSVHMGQEFGLVNQLVMLAACAAILTMAVAAAAMWWARRPAGRLGAPPLPADLRLPRAVLAIAVVAGVVFPLLGLSLILVLAADLALGRLAGPRAA